MRGVQQLELINIMAQVIDSARVRCDHLLLFSDFWKIAVRDT